MDVEALLFFFFFFFEKHIGENVLSIHQRVKPSNSVCKKIVIAETAQNSNKM